MPEELKQAAQAALDQLEFLNACYPHKTATDAADALRRALTQRPAAQEVDERGAFEAWYCENVNRAVLPDYLPKLETYSSATVANLFSSWKAGAAWLRASLPAPQQATPEPLTLGPLAKRNIYDAIRGAYDLGYNDARNARTVPGDSAPGYDGRSVEEDHGGALFNLLSKRLTPATPEPVKHKCRHCGVTTIEDEDGVTMQGLPAPEHPIIFDPSADVPIPATPEPVGEPVARVELMQAGGNAGLATRIVEIDDPLRERLRPGDLLYTRPAPGVPEGWRNVIAGTLKTDPWDSARVADYNSGWNDCQRKTLRGLERLAAAQAKGAEQ